MYFRIQQPKALSSIPRVINNPSVYRQHNPIAIIDNELFPHTKELAMQGFTVVEVGNIRDFAAVATYPIIACDIKDVGDHFGTAFGGAYVIGELRKRYPDKFLIGYSGGSFGPQYKRFLDSADMFITRDAGFDQWKEALDTAVMTVGDPVRRWKRIRAVLLEADMPAFEVFLLEDAYIKSILKKDEFVLAKALKRAARVQASGEIIEHIAEGLILFVKLAAHLAA